MFFFKFSPNFWNKMPRNGSHLNEFKNTKILRPKKSRFESSKYLYRETNFGFANFLLKFLQFSPRKKNSVDNFCKQKQIIIILNITPKLNFGDYLFIFIFIIQFYYGIRRIKKINYIYKEEVVIKKRKTFQH